MRNAQKKYPKLDKKLQANAESLAARGYVLMNSNYSIFSDAITQQSQSSISVPDSYGPQRLGTLLALLKKQSLKYVLKMVWNLIQNLKVLKWSLLYSKLVMRKQGTACRTHYCIPLRQLVRTILTIKLYVDKKPSAIIYLNMTQICPTMSLQVWTMTRNEPLVASLRSSNLHTKSLWMIVSHTIIVYTLNLR